MRARGWRSGFTGRRLLGALAAQALLLPAFLSGLGAFSAHTVQQQFLDSCRSESQLLGALARAGLAQGRVEDVLDGFVLEAGIVSAELVESSGTIRRPSRANPRLHRAFRADGAFGQHGDDAYHMAVPISDALGRTVAALRLGFDERATAGRLGKLRRHQAWLALGWASLFALGAALVAHRLGASVGRLRRSIRAMATGHLDTPLPRDGVLGEVAGLGHDLESVRRTLQRNQREIADGHEHLRAILETASDGILVTDEGWTVRSANRAAGALLGLQPASLVDRPLAGLLAGGHVPEAFASARGAQLVAQAIHRDGRQIPLRWTVADMGLRGRWHICAFGPSAAAAGRDGASRRGRLSAKRRAPAPLARHA